MAETVGDRVLLLMPTFTYRAGAFLEAAGRLGIPVAVGTEQPHVLRDLNPSGSLEVDFHDLEGSTDRIVEFAAEYPLRAIVSTDDEGVLLAAMASEALGLQHSPMVAVRTALDKYHTRRALMAAGMLVPDFQRYSASDDPRPIAETTSYPCVVKPVSLAGSRGVMRADDPASFVAAFQRLGGMLAAAQGPDWILVEDFIPGVELALEGLLVDGELRVLAIFDKPDPMDGPYFEETIYLTPSRQPPGAKVEIVDATREAIWSLGLKQGPIHAEMRLNQAGVWMLEIAPRSIGGYCSRALRFVDGEGLEERILQHALRLPLGVTDPATPASGVMMIPIPRAGVLCEVRGTEAACQVPGVDELRIAIPVGGNVVPLPEGSQYLGFIFARGQTPQEVEAALRQAHQQLEFVILPPEQAEAWKPTEEAAPQAERGEA